MHLRKIYHFHLGFMDRVSCSIRLKLKWKFMCKKNEKVKLLDISLWHMLLHEKVCWYEIKLTITLTEITDSSQRNQGTDKYKHCQATAKS